MTELADLKPCPFCGGRVDLEKTESYYNEQYGVRKWWGVVCRSTKNLGGTCAIQIRPSASEESAIARWNMRTDPDIASLEAEIEALRKDAERYRWLRDKDQLDPRYQHEAIGIAFKELTGSCLDGVVDSIMRQDP